MRHAVLILAVAILVTGCGKNAPSAVKASKAPAARQPTAEEAEEGQERVDEDGELALPKDEALDDLADVELESGESPAEEVQAEVGPMGDADLADVEIED